MSQTNNTAAESMFDERNEWLQQRLGKFTSSELHRLLKGGSRPMTPEELKEAKEKKSKRTTVDTQFGEGALTYIDEKIAEAITGESKRDISELAALQWGAANELDAVLTLEQVLKTKVEYFGIATPKFFPYDENSGGSPDGLLPEDVVEVKCPYVSSKHINYLREYFRKETPEYYTKWLHDNHFDYYVQTQFNMMCTKRNGGLFVSYDPRTVNHKHRIAILKILPDAEMHDLIAKQLEAAVKLVREGIEYLQSHG